ncbi:MAG: ATP-binding protein [Methylacidiphilales bacterium]|nr:ATP-binding protein [Candidatus Methylacidiphilales bacterium]
MTTQHKDEIKNVPNLPAKDFFVSMLTRDIDLHDAILDLLDNCVDGAIRTRSREKTEDDSLEGFWAEIKFDEKRFVIEDNCGGIPWKIAKEYAFCMGKPEGAETKDGTIGVVGIGMKRAIFKMGRECHVHSSHKDDAFLVTIPKSWFADDKKWGVFDAEHEQPAKKIRHGTIIEISELEKEAKIAFGKGSSFRASFPLIVAESYSYLIEKGFRVRINGDEVKRRAIKICFESPENPKKKGRLIRPYVYESKFNDVEVFVVIGYRSRLPTQEEQDDDTKANYAANEAGWTVVCNDRVVLSNDRTIKTGWGFGGVPNFHNQFSSIAGIVEFKSRYTANLPVTTTKRGIDTSKDIYTLVRQRMQEGLKCFTKNTNRWKGFESELKSRFDKLKFLDLKELKKTAQKLNLATIRGEGGQRQFKPELPEKKKIETTRRISFTKELADIEKVSQHLFNEIRTPEKVGETCFDRFLDEALK